MKYFIPQRTIRNIVMKYGGFKIYKKLDRATNINKVVYCDKNNERLRLIISKKFYYEGNKIANTEIVINKTDDTGKIILEERFSKEKIPS